MAVYDADRAAEGDANQGDVFERVAFTATPLDDFVMDGMVTSHDCVCDKYLKPHRPLSEEAAANFCVTVAPVHPIDLLTGERVAAVRADGMPRYFHLPAEAGRDELVADLYLEQPVRMADLMACTRVTCLSGEQLARLWQQFLRLRLGEDYMDFVKELADAS